MIHQRFRPETLCQLVSLHWGEIFRTPESIITYREENGLENGQDGRGRSALSGICPQRGSLWSQSTGLGERVISAKMKA